MHALKEKRKLEGSKHTSMISNIFIKFMAKQVSNLFENILSIVHSGI